MTRDYIFVSYSHADTEWLKRLQIFLKPFPWGRSYKVGGRLWADPYIKTGDVWRREIDEGLARARIGVVLVSADSLGSGFINRAELPPLQEGAEAEEITLVCVPVGSCVVDLSHPDLLKYQWARPPDEPLNLLPSSAERDAALASIVRKLHEVVESAGLAEATTAATAPTARHEVEALPFSSAATKLRAGQPLGELHGVPRQRPHHVPRTDVRERIRKALLAGRHGSVGLTGTGEAAGSIGVHGQGGLGKTVAAIDLVHDEAVRRAFPDGIYWLTLGQTPDLAGLQSDLLEQLTGTRPVVESVTHGTAEIREHLEDRTCLLVLDDVWSLRDARAFDVAGVRSRMLITTRDSSLLTALGAEEIGLHLLTEPQALALLASWTEQSVDSLPAEASALVRRCGYLPLAVSVGGAMIRDGHSSGDLLAALEAGNVRFLDHPYANVFTSLRLSIDRLEDDERARFLELAVAPEDEVVPIAVVARLWKHTGGLEEYESRSLLTKLKNKGLLYLEGENGEEVVRLHDLQRDFLQLAAEDVPQLHAELLNAFAPLLLASPSKMQRAWWTLPADGADGRYLWYHLAFHLAQADRYDELRALLLDFDWKIAKLRVTGINALASDLDELPGDSLIEKFQGAPRLSAHVLGKDPDRFPGQLSRLLSSEQTQILALLRQATDRTSIPWLHPLNGSLQPPRGVLLRTFQGHAGDVNDVSVSADGTRAVSASDDKTLKVWNLETDDEIHTLKGHAGWVSGVAVSANWTRAISASTDQTLKVWNLETDDEIHTLQGHAGWVRGVSVSADGTRAVSASWDQTLKVWNLETGHEIHTLEGHAGGVEGVAVSADGTRAVSASYDQTLKVWSLETGEQIQTLKGHAGLVLGVSVSADGTRAVSASSDRTLKVWNLETGHEIHTLKGHAGWVVGVSVTPDGTRAVSASDDQTLKVWNLKTGEGLVTFTAYTAMLSCALTPDGTIIVAGDRLGRVHFFRLENV